jgi:hypothetical protein
VLQGYVIKVVKSLTSKERKLLNRYADERFWFTSDKPEAEWDSDNYGKLYYEPADRNCCERYWVNIYPDTLDECCEEDILYVLAHELGHLYFALSNGGWAGNDIEERRADEFAVSHGFSPKGIGFSPESGGRNRR